MSDIPEGYFIARVGGREVELLDYRREPNLIGPGEVQKKKKKKNKSAPKKSLLNLRDGNLCHYCKLVMANNANGPFGQTVEHVVPRARGGSDKLHNLVLAHRRCNEKLGDSYLKCSCDFCKEARRIHEYSV